MRLTARGRAGHGSMVQRRQRGHRAGRGGRPVGRHEFPLVMTETVAQFLDGCPRRPASTFDADADLEGTVAKLGPIARMVGATLRNTANPTMLKAGYKANVIPATAEAVVDGRFLPGPAGGVRAPDRRADRPRRDPRVDHRAAVARDRRSTATGRRDGRGDARGGPRRPHGAVHAVRRHRREDVRALGMRCFGFSPLRLPPDLDFAALFHGVDERVPVDALKFGARVLEHFLRHC